MKYELTKDEVTKIAEAIDTKQAATKRAINTEKNLDIRAIREAEYNTLQAIKLKLYVQELPLK